MGTDLPPGVIKGEFTFSPKPEVNVEDVVEAVKRTLHEFKAHNTVAVAEAEYVPTK